MMMMMRERGDEKMISIKLARLVCFFSKRSIIRRREDECKLQYCVWLSDCPFYDLIWNSSNKNNNNNRLKSNSNPNTERERNTKKETKANHKLLLVVFVSSVHKIQRKQPVGRFCFVVLIKNKTAHACWEQCVTVCVCANMSLFAFFHFSVCSDLIIWTSTNQFSWISLYHLTPMFYLFVPVFCRLIKHI